MINELWIIHQGICIYHKTLKDPFNKAFTGLNLEPQLFSGFISALINFAENQLENNNLLQKISFQDGVYEIVPVESCLLVLSLNKSYLSELKLKQSVISLSDEIRYIIQANEILKHLRLDNASNKPIAFPLPEYRKIFDSFLEKVLDDIYIIQNQLIMVDILTIVQILDDLKVLLDQLQISSNIIEYLISISPKAKVIIKNIEKIKEEPTDSLYQIQKELKTVVQNSIKSIKKNGFKNNNGGTDLYKKLLNFVKKNYSIMKQFQLEDAFFEEVINLI